MFNTVGTTVGTTTVSTPGGNSGFQCFYNPLAFDILTMRNSDYKKNGDESLLWFLFSDMINTDTKAGLRRTIVPRC